MSMRFVVLASGSAGNATYVEGDGFGLLIDAGLGPKQLDQRLAKVGIDPARVQAVLLTHTHGDHWNDRTFAVMAQRGIPLYCHMEHHRALLAGSPAFATLSARGRVLAYEVGFPFQLAPRLTCLPFQVRHDSGLTCGFRLEGPPDLFGHRAAVGYAADLGTWDPRIARTLANADVLALEFNHDVTLQKASGRSRWTIARNLGVAGHLSNEQAAHLVREVLRLSEPERVRHIVQLHLSQDCNRPGLAVAATRTVLDECASRALVHTAAQDEPGPDLTIGAPRPNGQRAKGRTRRPRGEAALPQFFQPMLPGWEE